MPECISSWVCAPALLYSERFCVVLMGRRILFVFRACGKGYKEYNAGDKNHRSACRGIRIK